MRLVRYYAAMVWAIGMCRRWVVFSRWMECGSWIGALSAARKRGWSVVREDVSTVTIYEGY